MGLILYEFLKEELGITPDNIQLAYTFLAWSLPSHQYENEFYEAWKIIREDCAERLPQVSRILDAALLRYIFAGERPDVDLDSVFEDLILHPRPSTEIADKIRNGFYKLKPSNKEIDRTAINAT